MELRDYLRIFWRRRWLIALTIAVAGGSALWFSSRQPPEYVAKAKVFIGPRSVAQGDVGAALEELSFSREFIASYSELLKSRPLAERVVEKEGLPFAPSDLVERIKTQIVPDTRIIEVSFSDTDPDRAERTANALVEVFVSEDIQEFGGKAGVQATPFEPALRPTVPVSPKPLRDGLLGAALGLALGIGATFLVQQLDTTLRSREDVELALHPLPVLAALPSQVGLNGKRQRTLFFQKDPKSPAAEALRILRTNVQFFSIDQPIRRILVTSPYSEDGKTTVAANLAASLAAAGVRTLLVEADLRRAGAHRYFDMGPSPGISELMMGEADLSDAIRRTGFRNLSVLTCGTLPPNPSELLGTQKMIEILEEASERVEMVVIDSPPALAVTDAHVLARHVDGVVLVIRAGRTHRERAKEAKTNFERLGARLLGVVLNDVNPEDAYYYYRYYHGYLDESKRERRKKDVAWNFPAEKQMAQAPPPKRLIDQSVEPASTASEPMPTEKPPLLSQEGGPNVEGNGGDEFQKFWQVTEKQDAARDRDPIRRRPPEEPFQRS